MPKKEKIKTNWIYRAEVKIGEAMPGTQVCLTGVDVGEGGKIVFSFRGPYVVDEVMRIQAERVGMVMET